MTETDAQLTLFGADENGLGPRLGPLICTAATFRVRRYDARDVGRLRRRGEKLGISDSKQSSGFGKMARAESLTLAAIERMTGRAPRTADALFAELSLDGLMGLRSPCPDSESAQQCWSRPVDLPAFGGDVADGRERIKRLEGRGTMKLLHLRSVITCPGALNAAVHDPTSPRGKLDVDLHSFERLYIDAHRKTGQPLRGICGMVGGIRKYAPRFGHFSPDDVSLIEEVKGASRYDLGALGDIAFEVKSDDRHLPVAFASMIGKYVREVAMERLNRFYQHHDTSLPQVSGYHDPKTRRMVEATGALRTRLKIAPDCFERRC